jgi:prevent-host-death family protein
LTQPLQKLAASEAKTHFGELLDSARDAPVVITKNNRPVAVVLSFKEFDELERNRDDLLLRLALEEEAKGMADRTEVERVYKSVEKKLQRKGAAA